MSLDPDTIAKQRTLLAAHRRTLAHLLEQAAGYGGQVFAPPQTANGIAKARADIRRIKIYLRERGVQVEDGPNDEAPPQVEPIQRPGGDVVMGDKVGDDKIGGDLAGRDINKSQNTFNISAPIQAGLANVGGTLNIETPLNIRVDDPITISGRAQGTFGDLAAYINQAKQCLGAMPGAETEAKQRIAARLDRLHAVLLEVPLSQAENVDQVARRALALIVEASRPSPDQELLMFDVESLKRAAASLARVFPIAMELASLIGELTQ